MKTKNKIRGFVLLSAVAAMPLFSPALVALSLFGKAAWSPIQTKTLTFAERVNYQRAIEQVYWRHRIWPKENGKLKPSLDAATSQADIKKKVEEYLRNSQLLADDWHHPLSAEQLQDEMNRMAQHTEQPEVLREIFAALGNDPFVVAECLARPTLAESMLIRWHSSDQNSHGQLIESARVPTPNEHFIAGPYGLTSGGSAGMADASPTIRSWIVSGAIVEDLIVVLTAPDNHFTTSPHGGVKCPPGGCVNGARGCPGIDCTSGRGNAG